MNDFCNFLKKYVDVLGSVRFNFRFGICMFEGVLSVRVLKLMFLVDSYV